MKMWLRLVFPLMFLPGPAAAQSLDIYLLDMSAATLIVTPQRESILIDSGHKKYEERDAELIRKAVMEQAGLKQIDHLVVSHFHIDHYGAILRLSQKLPIVNFYDHGLLTELKEDPKEFETLYPEYLKASEGRRKTLRPGDEIPLKQGKSPLRLLCLASDRETLPHKEKKNLECARPELRADDITENGKSIVLLLRFGSFEFMHTGDLTWNEESRLVCPTNLAGTIDVFQTSSHGNRTSNSPLLLRSIAPTIALVNNAPGKGGHPEVISRLKNLPDFRDAFQLHLNPGSNSESAVPQDQIANLGPRENCPGNWIQLSVKPEGNEFVVTNSRNGVKRKYPVR
jgi:competence protein ComEC